MSDVLPRGFQTIVDALRDGKPVSLFGVQLVGDLPVWAEFAKAILEIAEEERVAGNPFMERGGHDCAYRRELRDLEQRILLLTKP